MRSVAAAVVLLALLGVVGCGEREERAVTSRYSCPCCGHLTLPETSPGSLEICHVCFWQDDMVGFNRPGIAVGANTVSLDEARRNYEVYGACEQRFVPDVRPPLPEEVLPDEEEQSK